MPILLSENFRALFYAPFYAAYVTGAFKEAGVEVVLKPSPSPPAAAKALRAGEVDVMWGGPLRVMMVHDQEPGADLVCFCDVVARDPFFILGATPRPQFKLTDLARLKLATAILSNATDDSRDVEVLKNAAIERMAMDYRAGTS